VDGISEFPLQLLLSIKWVRLSWLPTPRT